MYAAGRGSVEMVNLFLHKDAGAKDCDGKTALIYAVEQERLEIVKILLDKEAGVKDNEGLFAIDAAINLCNIEIVKCLLPKENLLHTNICQALYPMIYQCVHSDDHEKLANIEDFVAFLFTEYKNTALGLVHSSIHKYDVQTLSLISKIAPEEAIKRSLILKNCAPSIQFGSFIDVLNRAAKITGENYNQAMQRVIPTLKTLSLSEMKKLSTLSLEHSDEMFAQLANLFPELSTNIKRCIDELQLEEHVCPICFEDSVLVYRNCTNCTCYVCTCCRQRVDKCPQCNIETIEWRECCVPHILQFLV